MSFDAPPSQHGDRNSLSMDERMILETKVIPNDMKWLDRPSLRDHALKRCRIGASESLETWVWLLRKDFTLLFGRVVQF